MFKKLFFVFFVFFVLLFSLFVFAKQKTIIYDSFPVKQKNFVLQDLVVCQKKFVDNKTNLVIDFCYKKEINVFVNDSVVYKNNNKQIGVIYDNQLYSNGNGINILGKKLFNWVVNVGDRNFDEFGGCSVTELNRGVCFEKNI